MVSPIWRPAFLRLISTSRNCSHSLQSRSQGNSRVSFTNCGISRNASENTGSGAAGQAPPRGPRTRRIATKETIRGSKTASAGLARTATGNMLSTRCDCDGIGMYYNPKIDCELDSARRNGLTHLFVNPGHLFRIDLLSEAALWDSPRHNHFDDAFHHQKGLL